MEQYKKDLIAKYWNDAFEQQLQDVLANNPTMVELFAKHPERKEEYKFKILDLQPLKAGPAPPNSIQCKTCLFKLPPLMVGGKSIDRYTVPFCKLYEQPETKPYEVLWEGEPCEYYEKET